MGTPDVKKDLSTLEKAFLILAFYGIGKFATTEQVEEAQAIREKLKSALKTINLATPPGLIDLVSALFTFFKALTNITGSMFVQAIEVLIGDVYSIVAHTGAPITFAKVWADVRNLFTGKASGLIDPADIASDIDLFISSLTTMLAWALSLLPVGMDDEIAALLANLVVGLDAAAGTTTDEQALESLFDILDAGADLSNNIAIEKIESVLRTLFNILTGGQSDFVKFFEVIKLKIQASKAAKQLPASAE